MVTLLYWKILITQEAEIKARLKRKALRQIITVVESERI